MRQEEEEENNWSDDDASEGSRDEGDSRYTGSVKGSASGSKRGGKEKPPITRFNSVRQATTLLLLYACLVYVLLHVLVFALFCF